MLAHTVTHQTRLTETLVIFRTMEILQWDDPGFLDAVDKQFRSNGILEIIDCFVDAAQHNPEFLTILLEANILGVLRPFLEREFRTHASPIDKHDWEKVMVYDQADLELLVQIRERGLMALLPTATLEHSHPSHIKIRRSNLSHVFDIILRNILPENGPGLAGGSMIYKYIRLNTERGE
jgi:hypothetical protein